MKIKSAIAILLMSINSYAADISAYKCGDYFKITKVGEIVELESEVYDTIKLKFLSSQVTETLNFKTNIYVADRSNNKGTTYKNTEDHYSFHEYEKDKLPSRLSIVHRIQGVGVYDVSRIYCDKIL